MERERARPDDVTVLIGIRDRADRRIELALRSLREQSFPAEALRILVVDYGSGPAAARFTAQACREYAAEHVRVEGAKVWSRSRCLNIGIRRARTKYLMASDVDILFSRDYVSSAVSILSRWPLSAVCSAMRDLPEGITQASLPDVRSGEVLPLDRWKEESELRYAAPWHPSIVLTFTVFYQMIRGYDEYFELWGSEDEDLWERFARLGLRRRVPDPGAAFYLHQWHPKYENVPDEERDGAIRRNADHARRSRTIVRNPGGWGEALTG